MRSIKEGDRSPPDPWHPCLVLTTQEIAADSEGAATLLRWTGSAWEETETERTIANPSPDVAIPTDVRVFAVLIGTQWVAVSVYSCG